MYSPFNLILLIGISIIGGIVIKMLVDEFIICLNNIYTTKQE